MFQQIGFIGLGAMGLPMVRNLAAAGHRLCVYDQDPVALERAGTIDGVSSVSEGRKAAESSDVTFTCLPNDAVLREIYLEEGNIAGSLQQGSLTVDCSTVSPQVTQEISQTLMNRGVRHLDAAMLGSVPQAEAAEIGFVVGGERIAFEQVGELLDRLGRFHIYAGPSGSANRIKLIHQTLVAANAVAVAEAIALCRATDTDLDCFYDVVCNGGGFAYSRYFEKRVPRMRSGDFTPLFMLQFMKKDAALASDLAKSAGLEMPLLNQIVGRFEQALEKGLGREDFSAVAGLYEEESGLRIADGSEA